MSSFVGVVASSSPCSPFHLLPPFSSAARSSSSSSNSFSLRAPKSSSPFFSSGVGVSLRSKSTTPKISIWVASKRVPLQTQESNSEYPYDGSDSDYDDDDEQGNKEEREQEFENHFEKDEEEFQANKRALNIPLTIEMNHASFKLHELRSTKCFPPSMFGF